MLRTGQFYVVSRTERLGVMPRARQFYVVSTTEGFLCVADPTTERFRVMLTTG